MDSGSSKSKLVSIIMPTFNRRYILNKAIQSVLSQTYKNWELIIVDDGSNDDTKGLVKSLNDARIKYLFQPHSGPSRARNYGLEEAKGDWVVYLDSDNELLENYLEEIIKAINENPDTLYILPKGLRTLELYLADQMVECIDDSADFPTRLTSKGIYLRKIHFDLNGFMHSRKIIEDGIKFDEEMFRFEDWDFVLSICNKYPNSFLYLNKVLYHYHQRYGTDGIVSNSSYIDFAKAFKRVYQKHKNSKLMLGQDWYPDRVNKNEKLERAFREGKAPPYYLRLFPKYAKLSRNNYNGQV